MSQHFAASQRSSSGHAPDVVSRDPATRWIPGFHDRRGDVRLLCFPHAGGGASTFAGWHQYFRRIAVCPVQYPGRETRWGEAMPDQLQVMVDSIADDLASVWREPFALFGHSFGALVAFELAHALLRRNAGLPLRLFLSGARAPHLPPRPNLHALPDALFLERVSEFNGLPQEVQQNAELIRLMLPILRSDFRLLESHSFKTAAKLPVAISVFGGLSDATAPPGDIVAWSTATTKAFRSRFLAGDHFFLFHAVAELAGFMADDLAATATLAAIRQRG